MSNVSIFQQETSVSTKRGISELTKTLASSVGATTRRITMNKGVFRRVINGKEAGKVRDGFINVIIVNALPKVSRQYYAAAYDPDGIPTLPDCWSNLGDIPDAKASNPQASTCIACPQNIDGSSANGKSRACRFQRRIAVILEGDMSGDIYQMNIPAASLFGKGVGNVHPFESYLRYLPANQESIDRIVTKIMFDENETADVLKFTPLRHLNDEEIDVIEAAQATDECSSVIRFTAAQQDKVTALPKAVASDDDEEFVPKAKPVKAKSVAEDAIEEPVKRVSKKAEAPVPTPKGSFADVISEWDEK